MKNNRFTVLYVLVILMMIAICVRLFEMQAIHGEQYYQLSQQKVSTTTVEKAPRGEILDRYGRPLITNRTGYSVQLRKTNITNEEFNEMVHKLLLVLEEAGCPYVDQLPISHAPYQFVFEDENKSGSTNDEQESWFSERKKITSDMTVPEIMQYYREKVYSLNADYTEKEARNIIGLRYDAEINGFSATTPYTVAEDIKMEIVTQIKERQREFPGVSVTKEYFRNYERNDLAAHILGGIGKMNAEEYSEKKNLGYGYNDFIGKRGIEQILERDLRGTNGKSNATIVLDENADITTEDIAPIPGNYAILTIDADLQQTAEDSLERRISQIPGADAGAVVVLDVSNGDVLACANYPSYHPATFNQDYTQLVQNPAKPIWNRAISGTYTPGSTLKPLIAIAALESGSVSVNEKINCNGIYDYYKDYQPKCWIWSESGRTHGPQNVMTAIQNSCNCYFYEVGRRTGIDVMNEYASLYGLGEKTGIELLDEASGAMSSPAYKEKIGSTPEDQRWYPGDVIQTSIGQSYSFFTPIQLASYISMIANGGTRYQTHIIKSIRSTVDGEVIKETTPTVLSKATISKETLQAVQKGMYGVVDEGSASSTFKDYSISLAGKTGTAQVGRNRANNALFVAYAPFENPEIAIAVVLEKGAKGANAASVAKDIFDEYFRLNKQEILPESFSELLP